MDIRELDAQRAREHAIEAEAQRRKEATDCLLTAKKDALAALQEVLTCDLGNLADPTAAAALSLRMDAASRILALRPDDVLAGG